MNVADRPVRIDAHQHFWDIESGEYDWPTPADGVIHRTFAAGDLQPELAAAGIDRTVLVQTVNTYRDTDSMLAAAADHRWIGAVVGWIPVTDPDAAEAALDGRFQGRLAGVPDPVEVDRQDLALILHGDVERILL